MKYNGSKRDYQSISVRNKEKEKKNIIKRVFTVSIIFLKNIDRVTKK